MPVPDETSSPSRKRSHDDSEEAEATVPKSPSLASSPRSRPDSGQPENHDGHPFTAAGGPLVMWGSVWKKRSNLSRTTKVFRLLRREARALLSHGEEWLQGGGSLHLGRVGLLAKEVMALLGATSPALPAPEPELEVENVREVPWDKTHICLRQGGEFCNGCAHSMSAPSERTARTASRWDRLGLCMAAAWSSSGCKRSHGARSLCTCCASSPPTPHGASPSPSPRRP
ncbi:unnamed protein product [Effrenium voratum]|uniref:Uncharacterized protein n=1 Tax=Effrenium voratum TaxID=2562239 RepID=A0AA36MPH3_9DINO|nr:unnamed protein product [Effrenium voratum]